SQLLAHLARASLTINSATSRESVLGVIKTEARQIVGAKQSDLMFGHDPAPGPPAALTIPLVGRDGRPYARLVIEDKHEGEFTPDDRAILNQFALVAAVAIDNA